MNTVLKILILSSAVWELYSEEKELESVEESMEEINSGEVT